MPPRVPTCEPGNQHGDPSGTIICLPCVAKFCLHWNSEASSASWQMSCWQSSLYRAHSSVRSQFPGKSRCTSMEHVAFRLLQWPPAQSPGKPSMVHFSPGYTCKSVEQSAVPPGQ